MTRKTHIPPFRNRFGHNFVPKTLLLLLVVGILSCTQSSAFGQCDFINDITGITQSTPPSGNAANPALYTQRYVLVNNQGFIYGSGTTPDFLSLPAGNYDLYAINFDVLETAMVTGLTAPGNPWSAVVAYGDDQVSNCLDYSAAYGTGGCPIVVCEQRTVCETDPIVLTSTGAQAGIHSQTYCLVCNDNVLSVDAGGSFDLSLFPTAAIGANCQINAVNYETANGQPMIVGNQWSATVADMVCTGSRCVDYISMDLDITSVGCGPLPVGLASFSGAVEGNLNQLSWMTSAESGLQEFQLERASIDGQFEPIAMVAPHGAGIAYEHPDRAHHEMTQRYRLRYVDVNGNAHLSEVVTLERNADTPISQFGLYPNPTQGTLHYDFVSRFEGQGRYEVCDLMGRTLMSEVLEITYGENAAQLNLDDLANASYIVSFYAEEQVLRRIVVKE